MMNATQYDEKKLLLQAADNDRTAFAELYKVHLNNLYDYIFLFTKSRHETEEILQDVFVRIWENRKKLTGVLSFKSYLFKAAKNKLISQVRHLQIRHRVLSEIKRNKAVAQETTQDMIEYKEYYLAVQAAIEKLPPKRKLIFRLTVENGLSYDEIASELNISKPLVKKQLYKAYDFVRQYLTKHTELTFSLLAFFSLSVF